MHHKQNMTWVSRSGFQFLNRLSKSVAAATFVVALAACSAGDEEIEVWVTGNTSGYTAQVNIQSLVDELSIEDIVVNRGNCSIQEVPNYGLTIKKNLEFGESHRVTTLCRMENIVEVEVVTDSDRWHFEF